MESASAALNRSCLALALALGLAACAAYAPGKSGTPSLEQRVGDLEQRVDKLDAGSGGEPARPSKAAIEAEIRSLEQERRQLLTRYYEQHPAIVAIDRRLAILHSELEALQ